MTEATAKKFAAIMDNAEANEKLSGVKDFESMFEIMKEYGVELTADEIKEVTDLAPNGELSEIDLTSVAGGGFLSNLWGHITSAVNGLLDGFLGSYSN